MSTALAIVFLIIGFPLVWTAAVVFMNWSYDRFKEPVRFYLVGLGATAGMAATFGLIVATDFLP